MSSLTRKMHRAAERKKLKDRFKKYATDGRAQSPIIPAGNPARTHSPIILVGSPYESVVPATFCDCYGTLFSHSFKSDDLLVAYLNALHEDGDSVILVSMDPLMAIKEIRDIGLHEDIIYTLSNKAFYMDKTLRTLIDDDPINRSKKLWHPRSPEFRQHMQDYLDARASAVTPAPEPIV